VVAGDDSTERGGDDVSEAEKRGDAVLDVLAPLLAEMRDDIAYWMKEARDGNAVAMQLLREKIENNHKRRMVELRFQRATRMRWQRFAMLPSILRIVLRTLTKREIPSDSTADTAILEMAVLAMRDMPREEQARMLGLFPPEVMIVVGSRALEIMDRQEKEEAAIERASRAESGSMLEDIDAAEANPESH
jgi:hypothetical protein